MTKRKLQLGTVLVLCLLAVTAWGYYHWQAHDPIVVREEMLSHLPGDANAVVFLDLAQLRSSPFLSQLLGWAPHPTPEQDYFQFVQATGFNYERDLDRVAFSVTRQGKESATLVIADGRFDRKKIEAYAARYGKVDTRNRNAIFTITPKSSVHPSYFTFLRDGRIAWTDDASYAALFPPQRFSNSAEWRERFSRLAGTPLFALIRQEPGGGAALAGQAPGGFRSPQLAALLEQLQWISIGAKPENNVLRVVVEGECSAESTVRQLNEMLGGIVVLAQAGLNQAGTRKKLDPQLREAYQELLQSAEVDKIDRGSSKSVRIVFEVTLKLLQAARTATPQVPAPHL